MTRAWTWRIALGATAIFWGCVAHEAFACDSYVVHVGSYHTDRELIQDVNEVNPGIGCRFDSGVEVGVYKNSYGDTTAYGVWDTKSEGLGLFAGVASGYAKDVAVADHGITPVAGAVLHGEYTTTRIMPSISEKGDVGVVMSFSVKF